MSKSEVENIDGKIRLLFHKWSQMADNYRALELARLEYRQFRDIKGAVKEYQLAKMVVDGTRRDYGHMTERLASLTKNMAQVNGEISKLYRQRSELLVK